MLGRHRNNNIDVHPPAQKEGRFALVGTKPIHQTNRITHPSGDVAPQFHVLWHIAKVTAVGGRKGTAF